MGAETCKKGLDIILEIDWQGARQIRQLFADARSIYIIPPSVAVLADRLQKRAQDSFRSNPIENAAGAVRDVTRA